jgi:nucleotide-binding universal stress UspA family protein
MKRPSGQAQSPIICGTDFSDPAGRAADVAALLARAVGQPLRLIHAAPAATERGRPPLAPIRDRLRREAARLRRHGVTVDDALRTGHADEVLVAAARETGARLIVVASQGTRAAERPMLGSVSERTAEAASAPTLVIRSADPFLAWLRGTRPLAVLVAFDFTVTADAALRWVSELTRVAPCTFTVAYANAPQDAERFGVSSAGADGVNPPLVQSALEQALRATIAAALGDTDVRLVVQPRHLRPDLALVQIALETGADLVVTGTHQHRGIARLWSPSVSRGLLHRAPSSVAVVPAAAVQGRVPRVAPLRRLLVTTDFSPAANRAIGYAVAMTEPGGEVRIVHVVHPRAIARGQFETAIGRTHRHAAYVEECGRRLEGLRPAAATDRGVAVQAVVAEGADPARAICQEAERFGADAIVIGSHGQSGLMKSLLGSVAHAVLERAATPVCIVKPPRA